MNFQGLTKVSKTIGTGIVKNSPTILTGISVAGVVATTIMGVRATPKALAVIDQAKYDKYEERCQALPGVDVELTPLTKKEVVKATWKCYLPTALMGAVTVGCIIGGNSINLRRNAAMAGLYSLSEKALKEYQAKVVEKIGEDKAKEIKDEIIKDKIKENPYYKNEIIRTGKGEDLCYDKMSGRYFWSNMRAIEAAVNQINKTMRLDQYVSLNDFYSELDLDRIGVGDLVGWYIDYGYVELDSSSQVADDGRPCLVIDFDVEPKYCNREF